MAICTYVWYCNTCKVTKEKNGIYIPETHDTYLARSADGWRVVYPIMNRNEKIRNAAEGIIYTAYTVLPIGMMAYKMVLGTAKLLS